MTAKTYSALLADIAAVLADNTTGAITEAAVRTLVTDILDSVTFPANIQATLDKVANIEAGATADMTGTEIATAYEAVSGVNRYTTTEKTKLGLAVVSDTAYAKGGTVAKGVVFITRAAHAAITNPPADVLYAFTD